MAVQYNRSFKNISKLSHFHHQISFMQFIILQIYQLRPVAASFTTSLPIIFIVTSINMSFYKIKGKVVIRRQTEMSSQCLLNTLRPSPVPPLQVSRHANVPVYSFFSTPLSVYDILLVSLAATERWRHSLVRELSVFSTNKISVSRSN